MTGDQDPHHHGDPDGDPDQQGRAALLITVTPAHVRDLATRADDLAGEIEAVLSSLGGPIPVPGNVPVNMTLIRLLQAGESARSVARDLTSVADRLIKARLSAGGRPGSGDGHQDGDAGPDGGQP